MTPRQEEPGTWQLVALVGELGYLVAVPLVVLAGGGRLLDRRLGSSPLLLLSGIIIAVAVSGIMIAKRVRSMTASRIGPRMRGGDPPAGRPSSRV